MLPGTGEHKPKIREIMRLFCHSAINPVELTVNPRKLLYASHDAFIIKSEELDENLEEIIKICEAAGEFGPEYDSELVLREYLENQSENVCKKTICKNEFAERKESP